MALMAWSKHFVTGIDLIDSQHKGLVALINAAAPQLASLGEAPARGVRPLLDRLAQYAVTHFSDEEALMVAGGIDPSYLKRHQRSHASFTLDVTQMISDSTADNNVSGASLLRFLTSWLTFHILAEDQSMARQLRAIQSGASPEIALSSEKTVDTSANAVLLEALTELFGLVSQRNQALKNMNNELRSAQAELARANADLETRVVERTARLKQANDELGRERKALIESLAQTRQAQSRLLQSEKMAAVGQLAAGVAHEINNPIGFVNSNFSSLTTYSERLFTLIDAYEKLEGEMPLEHPSRVAIARARELADLEYLRQDIPELLRESSDGLARVKRIVADLKDFSHVDESDWQDADINSGIESTLNVVASDIKCKATVVKELGQLPRVRCIPGQINQVLMNLLVNAGQAIETNGVITLRTRVVDRDVQIEVSDSGQGIPYEVQKRIFEPFFTTKPVGKGTGLGLSISWDIIKRHNGRLEVRSRLGEGATFTITLPIESSTTMVGENAA